MLKCFVSGAAVLSFAGILCVGGFPVYIRFTHTGSLYWDVLGASMPIFPFRTGFVRRTWN